jgi:chorismate synthase
MSSTFGSFFRVTTFGESNGQGLGVVIDGCPAGLVLSLDEIQAQLDRRRPGQSSLTTPRREPDEVEILSGVEDGITLGTPLALLVYNRNQRPTDYGRMAEIPRPSHADYTYRMRYGRQARSGGGRASARETQARVAAGAVAEKLLQTLCGIEIVAWVKQIGSLVAEIDGSQVTRAQVEAQAVRCPDPAAATRMTALVEEVKAASDSIGGVVECVCRKVPAGWGEPVFDKLEAKLAQAMLSLPAARGFAVGSGFAAAALRGSEHNDLFVPGENGTLQTATNRSGGIQGGISNGMPITFSVAFKPAPTIGRPQESVDYTGRPVVLEGKGRHDPCVLPRAVPVVEAMTALVLADAALGYRAAAPITG